MIKIEKAKPSDTKILANMKYQEFLWHNKHDKFYASSKNCKKELLKQVKDKIRNYAIFKAVDENKIAGMLICAVEKYPKSMKIGKSGFVDQIYVDKNYRKKGVGRKLVRRAIEYFKSKNLIYIELDAHPTNKIAVKFWESNGFKTKLFRMRRKV